MDIDEQSNLGKVTWTFTHQHRRGFGSDGLWQWTDNKDWVSVHKMAVIAMTSGDFDGNGQEDIAISFSASSGLWYRLNGKAWVKVHNLSPVNIVAADLDG